MRTTIKDIAAATGLSVTTVSLVLNHKPSGISSATRERVLKAAKEMDYRPNQLAVGLIKRRTNTIGLLVPDIRNMFYSAIAKEAEHACRKKGWTVMLCNTGDQHKRELEYIRVLGSRGVDGIILGISSDGNDEKTQESCELTRSLGIPLLLLDRTVQGSAVVVDHKKGGFLATEHLIKLGHRRIACITGPSYLQGSISRVEGYRQALSQFGIPFDESLLVEGGYMMQNGEEGVLKLADKQYTALFAFNDMMAYGAYKALRRQGKSVPDDVSVVGYDDIFFSEILEVPLTSVRQPLEELGSAAASLLMEIANGETENKVIQFEPQLIVRKSTAKPKE